MDVHVADGCGVPVNLRILEIPRCLELFSRCEYSFPGNVGAPLPCNFVKLVDVPDMDYHAANGKGEVSQFGYSVSMPHNTSNQRQ